MEVCAIISILSYLLSLAHSHIACIKQIYRVGSSFVWIGNWPAHILIYSYYGGISKRIFQVEYTVDQSPILQKTFYSQLSRKCVFFWRLDHNQLINISVWNKKVSILIIKEIKLTESSDIPTVFIEIHDICFQKNNISGNYNELVLILWSTSPNFKKCVPIVESLLRN